MKLHRPVAEQVVAALQSIFGTTPDDRRYYADKVLERVFKHNRRLGARDRRFIAESTYGIVRWWRLLRTTIGHADYSAIPTEIEIWQIFGAWLVRQETELPPWAELRDIKPELLRQVFARKVTKPQVRESVPDWLYDLGLKELGEERWHNCLHALNQVAPVALRVNRLKSTPEELREELAREDIACDFAPDMKAFLPDGLVLRERKNVFTSESFKLGLFEIQDGSSQKIAPLLDVKPGHRVIDGCAGAGGKTLHLAALLGNKGKIIAMDISQGRLDELRKRAARDGVDCVETRLIESAKTIKRLEKSADRVLLDVPCSGLGVLRRNPDAKWKLTPEDLPRLHALQTEILGEYSQMLKPGGRLVYATCSILPSENLAQVQKFLATHGDAWKLIEAHQLWPGEPNLKDFEGYDGFFAAVLERVGKN
jgi:16S rRNA (cytosine967-C5)-methyltransferase